MKQAIRTKILRQHALAVKRNMGTMPRNWVLTWLKNRYDTEPFHSTTKLLHQLEVRIADQGEPNATIVEVTTDLDTLYDNMARTLWLVNKTWVIHQVKRYLVEHWLIANVPMMEHSDLPFSFYAFYEGVIAVADTPWNLYNRLTYLVCRDTELCSKVLGEVWDELPPNV